MKAYRVADGIFETHDDDGVVILLRFGDGEFFALDGVARLIWQVVMSGSTPQEVIDEVMASFPDVSRDQIEDDVTTFFMDAVTNGLLEEVK